MSIEDKVTRIISYDKKQRGGTRTKYIHKFEQASDTGVILELLQKYVFVTLDIFKEKQQNKDIQTEIDAWLVFFCSDEPEMVEKLITKYPKFKTMYEEIYRLCENVEKVMEMFSEELRELDRNTVQYMIDEMQEEIDKKREQLREQNAQLREQNAQLREQNVQLQEQNAQLQEQSARIAELEAIIESMKKEQ